MTDPHDSILFYLATGKYKPGDKERRHTKGCNCKRSGCLKNYCECYEARILCSGVCRCVGCHNIEENMDAESLLTIKQDFKVRTTSCSFFRPLFVPFFLSLQSIETIQFLQFECLVPFLNSESSLRKIIAISVSSSEIKV